MAVNFYFNQPIGFKQRNKAKFFIESILKKEKKKLTSLAYIFCSDEFLLNINRQFLKHDYYTDIISFDLRDLKAGPIIGEIYISTDRVKENARINDVSIAHELHRVMIHGVLHLCGYRDKTKTQKKLMRSKEDSYLKKYGILAN